MKSANSYAICSGPCREHSVCTKNCKERVSCHVELALPLMVRTAVASASPTGLQPARPPLEGFVLLHRVVLDHLQLRCQDFLLVLHAWVQALLELLRTSPGRFPHLHQLRAMSVEVLWGIRWTLP